MGEAYNQIFFTHSYHHGATDTTHSVNEHMTMNYLNARQNLKTRESSTGQHGARWSARKQHSKHHGGLSTVAAIRGKVGSEFET